MKPTVLMVPKMPAALVTRLRESYEVLGPMDHSTPDALPAGAAEAEALLTMGSLRTDAALIDALPRLRLICCYGTGVEGVDGGHVGRGKRLDLGQAQGGTGVFSDGHAIRLSGSPPIIGAGREFGRKPVWPAFPARPTLPPA